MRVLLVCNTDGALFVFRGPIIRALLKNGVHVSTLSGAGNYMARLSAMGVDAGSIEFSRHSVSLISNWRLFCKIFKVIREKRPDVLHCFTHKAAIFGVLAGRLAGVPKIFVTVTGLGTVFATSSIKNIVLRTILLAQYRFAMRFAKAVFFQNEDDQQQFIRGRIVPSAKARLTAGSGVDVDAISLLSEAEQGVLRARLFHEICARDQGQQIVLLPARAVVEKGIGEFYKAAQMLNAHAPGRYLFLHIGLVDGGSTGYSSEELEALSSACGVHYLGFKENVLDYLGATDIVVLPSYREGMPRSLLESLCLGRAIVTTNAPGCRQVVRDGWNGYLAEVRNSDSLANSIARVTPEFSSLARQRSRGMAEEIFDERHLVRATFEEYGLGIDG